MENFPKQSRKAGLVELMRRDGDHGVVESFLLEKHGDLLGELLQKMSIVLADMLGGIFERMSGCADCFKIFESLSYFVKGRSETSHLSLSLQKFIMQRQEFFLSGLEGYTIHQRNHLPKLPKFHLLSSRFSNPIILTQ